MGRSVGTCSRGDAWGSGTHSRGDAHEEMRLEGSMTAPCQVGATKAVWPYLQHPPVQSSAGTTFTLTFFLLVHAVVPFSWCWVHRGDRKANLD